jgi:hypothetical protein
LGKDICLDDVARVVHEALAAYCHVIGESPATWAETPANSRQGTHSAIDAIIRGKITTRRELHDRWMGDMLRAGFKYGPRRDAEMKTHPCLLPFDDLPKDQQFKDALFLAIVKAFNEEL